MTDCICEMQFNKLQNKLEYMSAHLLAKFLREMSIHQTKLDANKRCKFQNKISLSPIKKSRSIRDICLIKLLQIPHHNKHY